MPMREPSKTLTYPLKIEMELDTTYFLYFLKTPDTPKRFSQILEAVKTQNKYRSNKPGTLKTSLTKALDNLEKEGIVTRAVKSRKFVTYRIRNKEKAKLKLELRSDVDVSFAVDRDFDRILAKDHGLASLHSYYVRRYASLLLLLEKALCKAVVINDKSSFISFTKFGRNRLTLLWDSLVNIIESKEKAEIKEFYEKDFRSMEQPVVVVDDDVSSLIESWKTSWNATLRIQEYLRDSYKDCLSRSEHIVQEKKSLAEAHALLRPETSEKPTS